MKKNMKFNIKNKIKWLLLIIICPSIIALVVLFIMNFTELSQYFTQNNEKGELFKVCLTVLAGFVAILVWHSGYKRVKVMEIQTKKTEEQIQAMYKGNVDTRFNNAVGHLGSENSTVVLGGIHALHQIAVENTDYIQVVHNLFCSFLRENSAKLYEKIDDEKTPDKCPVIIQTLIDYLFKKYDGKESIYKCLPSDLSFSTLRNINFQTNDILINVMFDYCALCNCNFEYNILKKCDFRKASLTRCSLDVANLTKCSFKEAKLTRCRFVKANLTDCTSVQANLTECSFYRVTLLNCFLGLANLIKCGFEKANLKKCNFTSATLTSCCFIHDFLGNAKLYDCDIKDVILQDTKLPRNQKTDNKK